ncbi:alpha/beta hydrolase family protein [Pacificibacter maritimus]|uniref:Alpha/beta hydrolase family protein n=1 Tax=Pacificibacter maritimus TaxID=762213 RepID=A0A3N4UUW3_9RHOB|nr:alpha/beta hydrolase [Pacificibacter maritimus]RPE71371.1 alpha/beta hydrolase family protein [Pacificibacter maritimus]
MLSRRGFVTSLLATPFVVTGAAAFAQSHPRQTFDYGPAKLDLFAIDDAKGTLVYVHGGGWRVGSRKLYGKKRDFAHSLGLNFVTLDYPKLPRADVPTQIDAVTTAFQALPQIGIDLSKTVALGHSAGAHLALMALITGRAPQVAGVISNDGLIDIGSYYRALGGSLPRVITNAFPDASQWDALSPMQTFQSPAPRVMAIWTAGAARDHVNRHFINALKNKGNTASGLARPQYSHSQVNTLIGTGKAPDLDQPIAEFIKASL